MTPAFRKLLFALALGIIGAATVVECSADRRYPAPWGHALAQHNHAEMPAWLLSHPDFSVCCSNRDCGMVMVPPRPVEGGWLVTVAGRTYPIVSYSRTMQSGDGHFWACILPGAETIRCLWAPPAGV